MKSFKSSYIFESYQKILLLHLCVQFCLRYRFLYLWERHCEGGKAAESKSFYQCFGRGKFNSLNCISRICTSNMSGEENKYHKVSGAIQTK